MVTMSEVNQETGRTGSWSYLSHLPSDLGEPLATPVREVWKMALAEANAHSSKQYQNYGTKDIKESRAPFQVPEEFKDKYELDLWKLTTYN